MQVNLFALAMYMRDMSSKLVTCIRLDITVNESKDLMKNPLRTQVSVSFC